MAFCSVFSPGRGPVHKLSMPGTVQVMICTGAARRIQQSAGSVMARVVKGLFVFGAGFGVLRFCNSQAIIGFDSGMGVVLVPKPAG